MSAFDFQPKNADNPVKVFNENSKNWPPWPLDRSCDLALYHSRNGRLWLAVWGQFELDRQQQPIIARAAFEEALTIEPASRKTAADLGAVLMFMGRALLRSESYNSVYDRENRGLLWV